MAKPEWVCPICKNMNPRCLTISCEERRQNRSSRISPFKNKLMAKAAERRAASKE